VLTPNPAHTLVSTCHKRRRIRSHWLTSCYGLHQKTSPVSIRPHSSAHTGDSSTQRPIHCQVGLASGRSLGGDWRRHPGRSRARWTDQLRNDTGSVPANLWRQAILRPAWPWWSDATARAGYAMTTTGRLKSRERTSRDWTTRDHIDDYTIGLIRQTIIHRRRCTYMYISLGLHKFVTRNVYQVIRYILVFQRRFQTLPSTTRKLKQTGKLLKLN